ncbi:hypothetical protein QFZ77_005463 [Paenibacillus sp. V4I3]|uniref:hypothetical protein n=1 Tax=unclassified Paenibacillus TaxID=185978 RepID=UPI00277D41AE|nr:MULTISPECIES: hypothetical protein [unclassified Paenibacillus]MDQ0876804.1 hypothetical protein [Paenibacillus sp. V4I3]MDQ0887315.1 hypothetical protein [Paenibacillus sp. V4I9]
MYIKKRNNRLATIALSAALALGAVTPAWADSSLSAITATIGKVSITGSSYFELKQIHVLPDQSGKLATFTITIHNEGSSELQFIDYWVRLKSKSGNQFSARLLPADKDKNRVAPGSTTDLTFYATVNTSTNLHDLVVQFIKWDFSQSNFERVLGEIAVPDTYTDVTPSDGAAAISVNGTNVKAAIKKFVSNKNEKYHVPTVYVTLENAGNHTVTIPAYLFSIRTKEGLLYPLEAKGLKDLKINPKESKEIQLSGSIPVAVSTDDWQLAVAETIPDLKLNVSVANFGLPAVTQQEGGSVGKEYSFTSKSGIYTTQLNGLHRLPWEDQDLLTADLTLSNKGEESLPIPKLSGYFLLDGAVKIDAKLIQTAKVIGLGAGASVNLQIAGKVPYTYEFSQIKLVLQENEGETPPAGTGTGTATATDVLEFSTQAELQAIPFIGMGQSYTSNDIGRKAKYVVRSVSTYEDKTNIMYSAMVEATNLEKRFTNVSKFVANFRSSDGTVFPATIAEVKNKISPTGKALLNVWASVPKGYTTANMNLLLGEAVTEGKLSEGEKAVADSYVNPVSYWLPDEKTNVATTLKNVELFPYTITIDKIGTSIDNNVFTLKFNYELTKEKLTEINTEGHNLLLVFEDGGGIKRFEKKFDFKDFDVINGDSTADEDTKMRLGKRENFKITNPDPGLIYNTKFLQKYTLSIYDEFQGQRKLLATQKADWFITTD